MSIVLCDLHWLQAQDRYPIYARANDGVLVSDTVQTECHRGGELIDDFGDNEAASVHLFGAPTVNELYPGIRVRCIWVYALHNREVYPSSAVSPAAHGLNLDNPRAPLS